MKPFGSKRRNKNQNLRDAIRVAAIASAEQSSETAAPIGPSAPTTPGESGVVGSGALAPKTPKPLMRACVNIVKQLQIRS